MSNPGKETGKEESSEGEADMQDKEILEAAVAQAAEEKSEEKVPTEEASAEEQLEAALSEVAAFRDVALRAEAEMQNVRRRTERDIENAHKFGIERFLQKLLPVVDSIEKAVESIEQDGPDEKDTVVEGIRLCYKLLLDVLDKEHIEQLDPLGEPFDPNAHEAMTVVENPDMEPNSVFAVVQKGYRLNERLLRPAMVMVTKAPAEPGDE
ncbi:MAG: nucleotide exchange factor GrpE [Gammaproteobacteria bacterium]|jgi:molecular chaperone GrpE|nr:nucleotide exchange factor GrpE [Gammaproteobacteria bacterium]|tara:strand:+ start:134 stop:760 length:627 start_codon:yes stop_codon:yes gene_type:complete